MKIHLFTDRKEITPLQLAVLWSFIEGSSGLAWPFYYFWARKKLTHHIIKMKVNI